MGEILDPEKTKIQTYLMKVREVEALLVARGGNVLYHLDTIYHLTPSYRKLKKNGVILRDITQSVSKNSIFYIR